MVSLRSTGDYSLSDSNSNFSLAVNLLVRLTAEAARALGPDTAAEIIELHHAQKRDAPSGTALRLAEAVAEGRDQDLADHLVLERAGDIGPRPDGAIGVQTLRVRRTTRLYSSRIDQHPDGPA